MSLEMKVAARIVVVASLLVAVIFLPAGSWNYWQGWLFLPVFVLPPTVAFAYFLRHDRPLIERRMRSREPVKEQKLLIQLYALLFPAAFLVPGFDHRFGWSRRWLGRVPVGVTLISLALVAGAFLLVFWVMKVNSYAGRTIRVDEGQHVISTGPYVWVRHPMYLGSAVLSTAVPLALGSWVALPVFALLLPFYVLRLLNEEKVLRAELPGYAGYCRKTRYHLLPFVW